MPEKEKTKAGHYEVVGETYAKMEFYEQGWNPYSRFLDVEKIDLILRKRINNQIVYKEIQVKFGKLHKVGTKFEKLHFDVTSWRFFKPSEFDKYEENADLYIAYILSREYKYEGDIFIFPVKDFSSLLKQAIPSKDKVKLYISHSVKEDKWYIRKLSKFNETDESSVIDVTRYRRNFNMLL